MGHSNDDIGVILGSSEVSMLAWWPFPLPVHGGHVVGQVVDDGLSHIHLLRKYFMLDHTCREFQVFVDDRTIRIDKGDQ
jgi:hypothetical protein